MKIAQVVSTFPPYMAGTGNVCYHNSLELARLGHDVTVFTSRYPDEDYEYPPLLRVVRSKPMFRVGNAPFLPRLAGISGYEIVHLHYPFIFGSELVLINSWLRHSTLVVTCHQDLIFSGPLGPAVTVYKTLLGDRALSRSRRILAPSLDYLANSSFRRHMEARKKEEVLEVPNGVDLDRFHVAAECADLRAKHGLRDRQVVLFVGALDRAHFFKGVDRLMKASLKANIANAVLMIIGEGDLRREYQRLAEDMGLSDRVVFPGRVADQDLPQYYALCDVLVLPSTTGGEAFGIVLVEAMACGKPVIASNLPGVRTVVDDGANGFLVPPGDIDALSEKMRLLLGDTDLRAAFGRAGRKKAEEKYDWKQIGKRLEAVYRDVLNRTA